MKRLAYLNVRMTDDEKSSALRYCEERGISPSELARRAIRNLVDAPAAKELGARPKRRQLEVSNVEEVGRDVLRANTGALKR